MTPQLKPFPVSESAPKLTVKLALSLFGVRRTVFTVPTALAHTAAYGAMALSKLTSRAPLFTPAAVQIAKLGLRADCTKAAKELGMKRRPLEQSVRDAVVWWAQRGYIRSPKVVRRVLGGRAGKAPLEPPQTAPAGKVEPS